MEKMNSNRIKELRLKQKKTQKDVANFLGITEQALSFYERGKREPKLEMWQKLADYFDVPIPYLQGLGVSRDVVIQDLVNEMIFNKENRVDPNFVETEHTYNLRNDLCSLLEEKTDKQDINYIKKNCDYIDLDYFKEQSANLFEVISDYSDKKTLTYLISKHVPIVNDYAFLATLNRNDADFYYASLDKEIISDIYKKHQKEAYSNNRIKELRLEKGLSQRKLAEETGISQQSLSFYEKGDRNPKIETWQRLADYFGVSVSYLQGLSKYKSFSKEDIFEYLLKNNDRIIEILGGPKNAKKLLLAENSMPFIDASELTNKSHERDIEKLVLIKKAMTFFDNIDDPIKSYAKDNFDTLLEKNGENDFPSYLLSIYLDLLISLAVYLVKNEIDNKKDPLLTSISELIDKFYEREVGKKFSDYYS